jgi:OPT oligopeptide transporter protein
LQWRLISFAFKAVARAISSALYDAAAKAGKDVKFLKMKPQDESNMVQDPAPPHDLPPMWIWGTGLILSIIGMCIVMGVQFHMPVGMTLLAVFLAFFFSFLAIQCSGVTG